MRIRRRRIRRARVSEVKKESCVSSPVSGVVAWGRGRREDFEVELLKGERKLEGG